MAWGEPGGLLSEELAQSPHLRLQGLGELPFRVAPANSSKPIDACFQITHKISLYGHFRREHILREHMPFGALCLIELGNKHSAQRLNVESIRVVTLNV